jgi:hypothetical protein
MSLGLDACAVAEGVNGPAFAANDCRKGRVRGGKRPFLAERGGCCEAIGEADRAVIAMGSAGLAAGPREVPGSH